MNFKDYQEKAWSFALDTAKSHAYIENGLVGEVGEVYSILAKATRDGVPEDYDIKLKKELGDVLWFVAGMATMHGFDLQEIADLNVRKLEARKAFGTIGGSGDNR